MILNFDATQIEVSENNYEVIPDNTVVNAVISASEWKETKDKTGGYLSLKWEVIEGQYKGRVIFENINLQNSNEKAVKIAQETLAKICNAIGKQKVANSEELHNIPLSIKLGVTPAQNGYEPSNKIKSYSSLSSGANQVQPQSETKPPWAK